MSRGNNKLVKRIEELKKHDNVDILPRKDLENEESSLTIVETLCIRISVMDLVTLTLSYLYFFVIVSYRILDFNILIGLYVNSTSRLEYYETFDISIIVVYESYKS
ncbi:hypothetical protein E3Q17_04142 [Wallemia mellicola]|uniref:Uncharacterized protein n=1 Tax=Wallemia mellicola TaxID=1708541 RepID=A0A4T0NFS2_9BASI|nr:hypothetical protein E3Q17_04142 [Wallemia mellicola]